MLIESHSREHMARMLCRDNVVCSRAFAATLAREFQPLPGLNASCRQVPVDLRADPRDRICGGGAVGLHARHAPPRQPHPGRLHPAGRTLFRCDFCMQHQVLRHLKQIFTLLMYAAPSHSVYISSYQPQSGSYDERPCLVHAVLHASPAAAAVPGRPVGRFEQDHVGRARSGRGRGLRTAVRREIPRFLKIPCILNL
jgi:hypothetical protein